MGNAASVIPDNSNTAEASPQNGVALVDGKQKAKAPVSPQFSSLNEGAENTRDTNDEQPREDIIATSATNAVPRGENYVSQAAKVVPPHDQGSLKSTTFKQQQSSANESVGSCMIEKDAVVRQEPTQITRTSPEGSRSEAALVEVVPTSVNNTGAPVDRPGKGRQEEEDGTAYDRRDRASALQYSSTPTSSERNDSRTRKRSLLEHSSGDLDGKKQAPEPQTGSSREEGGEGTTAAAVMKDPAAKASIASMATVVATKTHADGLSKRHRRHRHHHHHTHKSNTRRTSTGKTEEKDQEDEVELSDATSELGTKDKLKVLLEFIPYYGLGDTSRDNMVRSILSAADPGELAGECDEYDNTLLIRACQYKCRGLVPIILARGEGAIDVNAVNAAGACALHFACYKDSICVESAVLLLERGAKPEVVENTYG